MSYIHDGVLYQHRRGVVVDAPHRHEDKAPQILRGAVETHEGVKALLAALPDEKDVRWARKCVAQRSLGGEYGPDPDWLRDRAARFRERAGGYYNRHYRAWHCSVGGGALMVLFFAMRAAAVAAEALQKVADGNTACVGTGAKDLDNARQWWRVEKKKETA